MTDFTQTLKKRIFWMRAFTGTVFAIIMLGLLNEFPYATVYLSQKFPNRFSNQYRSNYPDFVSALSKCTEKSGQIGTVV